MANIPIKNKEATQSDSHKTFNCETTEDDTKRACTMYVLTRRIDVRIPLAKHVALYFDWGDTQAIYEAYDVDGKLISSWSPETIEESEYKWFKKETYKCTCSPEQVNRAAEDLKRTGNYRAAKNNCQKWAYDLAKALSVTIKYPIWTAIPVLNTLVDVIYAIGARFWGSR